ncbi:hypothetical protein [Verrucomicrobium sp. BvORR106]|uniref:hypothetical protein n=1 Tax=Verrucomicrobium sp. BvORR106 TaxID=1403819 RepID=UPI00056F3094|nr:hypothetical protein [Verrucomicrobium sp. BvORR106]
MGFFSNLFKSSSPASNTAAKITITPEQEFDEAWERNKIYFDAVIDTGPLTIPLNHPETHAVMKAHQGLNGTFEDWTKAKSPWEKRDIILECIFDLLQGTLSGWQVANYLTATRRPSQALDVLERTSCNEDCAEEKARYAAAVAWAYLAEGYEGGHSQHYARIAVEKSPNNHRYLTLLADCLHIEPTGDREESHKIYGKLMSQVGTSKEDGIEEMFTKIYSRVTGGMPSPVMAILIANSLGDPAQSKRFWQLIETEYYDSPYFREQHAIFLAGNGELVRAYAKLRSLVQANPHFESASLRLLRVLEHIDPDGTKFEIEYRNQLVATIQKNGWK